MTNFPEIEGFEWQKSDFGFTVDVVEVGALIERTKKAGRSLLFIRSNEMEYDPIEVLE